MDELEALRKYFDRYSLRMEDEIESPVKENANQKQEMFSEVISRITNVLAELPDRAYDRIQDLGDELINYIRRERDRVDENDVLFIRKYEGLIKTLGESLENLSTKEELEENFSVVKGKVRSDFFEKEEVVENRNGRIENEYFKRIIQNIGDSMKELLYEVSRAGVDRETFEYCSSRFTDILQTFATDGRSQQKFCFDMVKRIDDLKINIDDFFEDKNLEIIKKYQNGELPIANNGQFDFYIIKEPKIDVNPFDDTQRTVLEKGEFCSVAAFERVYGLVEDDKYKPTTISVEGENTVYYMTIEENQRLLENHKERAGGEVKVKYGPGTVKEREKQEKEEKETKEAEARAFLKKYEDLLR